MSLTPEKTDLVVKAGKVSEIRVFPKELVGPWFRGPEARMTRKKRFELLQSDFSTRISSLLENILDEFGDDITDPSLSRKVFFDTLEVARDLGTADISNELAEEIYEWVQALKSNENHYVIRKHWLQYATRTGKPSSDPLLRELVSSGPTREWAKRLLKRMIGMCDYLLSNDQRELDEKLFAYHQTSFDDRDGRSSLKREIEDLLGNSRDFGQYSRMYLLLMSRHLTKASSSKKRYHSEAAKTSAVEVVWDIMESLHLSADVLSYLVKEVPRVGVDRQEMSESSLQYNDRVEIPYIDTDLVYLGEFRIPDNEKRRRIHMNAEPLISGYLSVSPKGRKKGLRLSLPDGMIQQFIALQRKLRSQRDELVIQNDEDPKAHYLALVDRTEKRILTLESLLLDAPSEPKKKNINARLQRARKMLKVLEAVDIETSKRGVVAEYTPDAIISRFLAYFLADMLLSHKPELFYRLGIRTFDELLEKTDMVGVISETRRVGHYAPGSINMKENLEEMPLERVNQMYGKNGTILPEVLLVFSPLISFGHYDLAKIIE